MRKLQQGKLNNIGSMSQLSKLSQNANKAGALAVHPKELYSVKQVRTEFDEECLLELGNAMLEVGQDTPCIVYPRDEKGYRIHSGERRWRAANLVNMPKLNIIVDDSLALEDFDGEQVMSKNTKIRQASDNINRNDLTAMEVAYWIQDLLNPPYKMKKSEIAKAVSKNGAWVSRHIKLLSAPDYIVQLHDDKVCTDAETLASLTKLHELSESDCRELVEKGEYQRRVVEAALRNIKEANTAAPAPEQQTEQTCQYQASEEQLNSDGEKTEQECTYNVNAAVADNPNISEIIGLMESNPYMAKHPEQHDATIERLVRFYHEIQDVAEHQDTGLEPLWIWSKSFGALKEMLKTYNDGWDCFSAMRTNHLRILEGDTTPSTCENDENDKSEQVGDGSEVAQTRFDSWLIAIAPQQTDFQRYTSGTNLEKLAESREASDDDIKFRLAAQFSKKPLHSFSQIALAFDNIDKKVTPEAKSKGDVTELVEGVLFVNGKEVCSLTKKAALNLASALINYGESHA